MKRLQWSVFCLFFALLAGPTTVEANEVINVHLNDKVPAGKKPSLVVSVHRDLKALTLNLVRGDGKKIHQKLPNVPRNSKRTFSLPQKSGRHRYKGTLEVTFPDGEGGAMNLDFVAEVVATLGLRVDRDDLDLDGHKLHLRTRRPIARLDYEIISENGSLLGEGSKPVSPAGTRVDLEWQQKDGKVLKIGLVAHDADGIHEDLELIPWRYHIPHEEVEFETGKWEIRDSQKPRLNRSYELLKKGLAKYGKLLEVKLYIAGYTDTVAAADYNLQLSGKRALSIARYFRSKGFRHPIYYQGYGERGLKVPTPDETDEPRNRRAEYVLAAEPPTMNVPGSAAHWKRLGQDGGR